MKKNRVFKLQLNKKGGGKGRRKGEKEERKGRKKGEKERGEDLCNSFLNGQKAC